MSACSHAHRPVAALVALLLTISGSLAQQPESKTVPPAQKTEGSAPGESKPGKQNFGDLVRDAQVIEGLLRLYRKEDKLYAEIPGGLLDRDFIVVISIARGIGEGQLLGGMSWGFGDDWLWQFRIADDRIQVVRRNVRFTAPKGSPEERAVRLAYTDSVLFSLPILSISPAGAQVVELTPVFMSDLPQIASVLEGFAFSREKSSWAEVKGFRDNLEIEVAATYASGGARRFDTVADSRGVTINVHYSISLLPETGYQPRLADDRVGYFVTALKSFSSDAPHDWFVRYINRWDLRKADPAAKLSPPKKPIVFWLEKTIPFEYRKPIREGILEWNKAFEAVGLANAIEVRQQPDDADWDPEDIHYNTFRWITSGVGLAMGPSRVNPTTGEILDADIIFDADFLHYWRNDYEVFTPQGLGMPFGWPTDCHGGFPGDSRALGWPDRRCACTLNGGMAQQLAFAALALAADPAGSQEQLSKLVIQAMKMAAMHEVGHTLGLRHNFKASALWTLEEINDPQKTAQTGMAASVMDYLPINFAPKGHRQGDYFSTTLGPYDYWAIQYGYQPLGGSPADELAELKKIASRAGEPAYRFATDEDVRSVDPDPLAAMFDLGSDPIEFGRWRAALLRELAPGLVDRVVRPGESYELARRGLNVLLLYHGTGMYVTARLIGGLYVNRNHKGDPNAPPPVVVVEPKRQRDALALLCEEVFSPSAYQFPPELYNQLVPARWSHWGIQTPDRVDYPIQEIILGWQDRVLGQLLSTTTLNRLADSELKVPADQDAFTAAELFQELTKAIFQETEKLEQGEFTNRKPAINALRRSLQQRYFERLASVALGTVATPKDCQSMAYSELEALEARINQVLAGRARLDTYTRAHLKELAARIRTTLHAQLERRRP